MSQGFMYTKQLELLILDTLLPVYEKYQKSRGVLHNPLKGINPSLLEQIRSKRTLPALLRAY